MASVADVLDRFQRRFKPVSMPLATIYKYFDDQGNYLAAIITFYAFLAIFPLLLLASSILGYLLQGNPDLQAAILDSALSNFPIVGEQLGRPEGLQGSLTAIVVGVLTALYGASGLGQAIQNAMNVAWSVPRNSRPNPFLLRFKSLVLLVTAGLAVLALTVVSAVGTSTEAGVFGDTVRVVIRVATVVVIGMGLTLLFRLAAARQHTLASAAPGAFVVAVLWQGLQYVGTVYATRVLGETTSMNQTFGLVLGLLGIIYIAAVIAILGMEVNVVLARRLYPRALLTPFTDAVELTEADRRAYAGYARAQRHKGFERVEVVFDDDVETERLPVQPRLEAVPDPSQDPPAAKPAG
ncbi:YihY/virulence factor BrkB family protein [Nocardioides sp. CFH 31398]|uniref:YihY/virulence factor BrkB family protein n=1 Tax=Nocardioides sp. CFH 31398 TaxID=2919579 RepID=UPI001F050BF6|nr:YihY/virulence factor BrkB family protein [Nocardioides sp. CFH 31398]MCH1865823.1 YihY/virulence factor BrkB family protein [Nocardioides sp. CFH 31398]